MEHTQVLTDDVLTREKVSASCMWVIIVQLTETQIRTTRTMNAVQLLRKNAREEITSTSGAELRRLLMEKKQIHLDYEPYNTTEPSFASAHDRELFLTSKVNRADLEPIGQERLKGIIAWMSNGTANKKIDCGYRSHLEEFKAQANLTKVEKHKLLCPLLVPDSWSFQHFMDGVLPKLMQVLPFILQEDVKLLVLKPADGIISDIYKALGIKESQLVYSSNKPYYADHMINTCVTPPLHPDLWWTAKGMLGVPELPVPRPETTVILLTRTRTRNGGRTMLNYPDVLRFLQARYGDKVVVFNRKLGLSQSISMFSRARIILGVHGGAFYNIYFAPKGTHVIEILPTREDGTIPKHFGHTIYWQQAIMLEQPYWRICATPQDSMENLNVDLNKVKVILDQIDARD